MERYFLEKSITDFFNGRNSTNKLELIYSIINEVEIFNTINPFDMEIDLLEIETEVLDILSSDVTTDEIEYLIMSKYKESIEKQEKATGFTRKYYDFMKRLTGKRSIKTYEVAPKTKSNEVK